MNATVSIPGMFFFRSRSVWAVLFLLFFGLNKGWGQVTYTWIGGATGTYATAGNWNPLRSTPATNDILVFDGSDISSAAGLQTGEITCTGVPTETIGRLSLINNASVILRAASSANQTLTINNTISGALSVAQGSTLTTQGFDQTAARTLTITLSGNGCTAEISGRFRRAFHNTNSSAFSSLTFGAGTPSPSLVIKPTGVWEHAITAGSIPTATWETNATNRATLEITGVTSALIPATGTYQNVIWNCAGQSQGLDLEDNFNNINGNFTILSTNGFSLNLEASNTQRTLTIGGDFSISGNSIFRIKRTTVTSVNSTVKVRGNLTVDGGGNATTTYFIGTAGASMTNTLEVQGGINVTNGGNFQAYSATAGGTGVLNIVFTNDASLNNSSTLRLPTNQDRYQCKWNINIKSGRSITLASDIEIGTTNTSGGGNQAFTVENGGTLNTAGFVIKNGTGIYTATYEPQFSLSSGATLITANTAGISSTASTGAVQVTGTKTFDPAANYTYNNSTTAQVTGNALPSTVNNLTINNSSGVTLTNGTTVSGILTLSSGRLAIGSNTLTLNGTVASMSEANSLTGSSTSNLSIGGTGDLGTLFFNQTTNGTTNNLATLTLNRTLTGRVTLGNPATVGTTLTLTNGILTTTSTNTLTVANSSTGAISGGSSTSYINGPLDRTLAGSTNYTYPVGGNSSNYRPISLNSVNATSNPVVRVTVAEIGATTVDGTTLTTLLSARNWSIQKVGVPGTFTSATLAITEAGIFDGIHEIGKSNNNQAGTYVSCGTPQTVSAGVITTPSAQGEGVYAIGIKFTNFIPSITLADNGTQVAASNLTASSINNILHRTSLAVTTADAILTGVSFTTAGTYVAADVSNFKVWYSADNTFSAGSDVLLGTISTSLGTGSKSLTSLSQAINSGSTGYIFITTDISATPTHGNTINVSVLATSDITFVAGTKSGSTTAGGSQSFCRPTANAGSALSAICQGAASVSMGGSVGGSATGGTWSGGAGTWSNANNPSTAIYTAGSSESGSITLTLTTSGGVCGTTFVTKDITVNVRPTTYYSNSTTANTNANTLTSWSSNTDGSGCSPTSFTAAGQTFIIQSGHQYQITSNWTGSATGIIQVQSGGALDINSQTLSTWQRIDIAGTGVSGSGALLNSSTTEASLSVPVTLTAASTIVSSGSGGLSLTGNINNGGFLLTVDGLNATSISTGVMSGSGGLTKTGLGTLTLSGANTFTGQVNVIAGVLNIRNAQGTGTTAGGVVVASGAALELQGGITVGTEALTINNTGVSSGGSLRNISGDNTWGGTVTLSTNAARINSDAGTLTLIASNSITATNIGLTVGGAGNVTVSGTITTGSGTLTKEGDGTLILSGTNTYTGATNVNAGVLNIRNAQGTGTTAGGVVVASGAALELQGGITVGAEALTINNTGVSSGGSLRNISGDNTWGGTITLSTNAARINSDAGTLTLIASNSITATNIGLIVGGAGNVTVSGTITTGSGTLTKEGDGTLILSGTNTYTGATNVNAGVLNIRNAQGTGTTAGGVVVASGAALELLGAAVGAETLSLAGTGISSGGALRFISGTNSWAGLITLTATTRINADPGTNTIDVASGNAITGNFNLTVGGGGNLTIADPIATGTATFTKDGNGTLTFSGANTYTGVTTVAAGTLRLGAAGVIADASNLVLNGGTLSSGASAGFSETMGTLSVTGASTIALGTGNHTLTFSASNGLSWTNGSLTVTGWTGTAGATGSAGKIVFSLPGGLSSTQLGLITFQNYGGAIQLTPSGEVVPIGVYYSRSGQSNPNLLTNWTSNADGSGNNPGSFTGDGMTFIIQSGHSYTTTAAWNLTGTATLQVDGNLTLSHVLTLGTASTKAGNLTVNGTVQANAQHVIANTSGVFTINSGGRYILNHTTGSNSSTSFNGTNTFNNGSTFEYQNLTSGGFPSSVTYHHLTISGNITETFPVTITINGNLNISAGTITMNKNQTVTGAVNVSGGTLQITNNSSNYTLTATGGVNVTGGTFNMATSTGTAAIIGNVAVSGGSFYAVASGAGAVTSTITGNLSVTGGTFYVTGNTPNTTHILDLNGTLDLSNTGVIEFNPIAAATGAGRLYVSANVTVSGGTMQRTQTRTDGSTGIYFDGTTQTFTWSGGAITNAMPNRFYVNGVTTLDEVYSHLSSAQTTVNGLEGTPAVGSAWPTSIRNLTIGNTHTSGVTLSTPKTVTGSLTFNNGFLVTGASNILTIANANTNAIVGAGTDKYVSGPLRWNLSNSPTTYVFPVGKAGNYYPFTLNITAASNPVITVEAFAANAGGSLGSAVSNLSNTEYWNAVLNSGSFSGNISVTRPSALGTLDCIARSSSQNGSYSSIGGTPNGTSIVNSFTDSYTSLGFFLMAKKDICFDPTLAPGGITFSNVSATGMTINWSSNGNGDGVFVVMKAGSAPTDPSDNTVYSANTSFGTAGSEVGPVGSGSFVVYNGSGTSVIVTGLLPQTTYFVRVYSENCSGIAIQFNNTPAEANRITLSPELIAHPASFTRSSNTCSGVTLNFSAFSTITGAAGYLILRSTTGDFGTPLDATSYPLGSTLGNASVAAVVTNTSATSSVITGLSSGTAYTFQIIPFSFNGSNTQTYNYFTTATIKTVNVTLCAVYYVNDDYDANDVYTSIGGNDINNGKSAATPKRTVKNLLESYVLSGSDTVFIDNGNYTESFTITTSDEGLSTSSYLVFKGAGSAKTVFSVSTSTNNVFINNSDFIWIEGINFQNSANSGVIRNIYKLYGQSSVIRNCKLDINNSSSDICTNIFIDCQSNIDLNVNYSQVSSNQLTNNNPNGIGIRGRGDVKRSRFEKNKITLTGSSARCFFFEVVRVSGSEIYIPETDTIVQNNINTYGNGIWLQGSAGAIDYPVVNFVISKNSIKLNNNTIPTAHNAVYLYSCGLSSTKDIKINQNFILGGYAGIYLAQDVLYLKNYNNYICSNYGLYDFTPSAGMRDTYSEFVHNSIYSLNSCLYFVNDSYGKWEILNNIFYTYGSAPASCLEIVNFNPSGTQYATQIDGNLYFRSSTAYIARKQSLLYTNLSAWQQNQFDVKIVVSGTNDPKSFDGIPPRFQNAGACDLDLLKDEASWVDGYPNPGINNIRSSPNYSFGITNKASTDIKETTRVSYTVGAFESISPLPVQLLQFTVTLQTGKVNLKWLTADEEDNAYFIVEKSLDGRNWSYLTKVEAAQSSQRFHQYEAVDAQPGSGIIYYRLKQVDLDGKYTYSEIRKVQIIQAHGLSLFPNPGNGWFTVSGLSKGTPHQIRVVDMAGKLMHSGIANAAAESYRFNMDQAAPGVYFLQVDGKEYLRMVVTK